MAENDQGQEKTEQPTAKKMQELLEGGQFAKSQEVSTLVLLVLAMLVFTIMAPRMVETFRLFLV
ncbi:EscU/YscU/HrcU family type III secretion system export apparatus switch protein, partial [Verrucomicrobia bacterium]|nr:EscU/YscU/HrcU family type III secretion system export apparatus switch protein [Verrucomicrobiota bacterium]